MSNFANSQLYNVNTENELAVVLSHYDSQFVLDIMNDHMRRRFKHIPNDFGMPNVVAAWEQNFKLIQYTYGDDSKQNVLKVRNDTYVEVIESICKEFGLNINDDENIDIYSAAYHLYNFFVCSFTDNLITFFSNFIYRERNAIYEAMGLADLKKNKDSSTIYGKRVYKDIKLAVINANIDRVVSEVPNMDIPFETILSIIYGPLSEIKNFLLFIVKVPEDFISSIYGPVLNSDIRADIITRIRFNLQELAMNDNENNPEISPVNNINKENETNE